MNKFIFVLGSNWQLSIAELDNVLKYSRYKGNILDYSANVAIVEFESLYKSQFYINEIEELQFLLGGCQKIAEVYDFIDIRTIREAFPEFMEKFKLVEKTRNRILKILEQVIDQIFPKIYESMFFAVSIYPNLYDEEYYSKIIVKHLLPFLNTEIMKIVKEKGAVKSLYYKYPEKNINAGNLNPIFPHNVIKYELLKEHRAEIIFGFTEEGVYISRTYTVDDPSFKKKVDEQRPFKEFKSSISPKLALVMLNFLNLFDKREATRILDPFVGNGTIPLFALFQDFQVYGSDIDNKKINYTIRNLNWLLKDLDELIPYLLNDHFKTVDINNLSNKFELNFFDGICTEPPLGPFFREKPNYIEARKLIEQNLEPIYDATFREAQKVLKKNKRISIIAPIIGTIDGKDVQINVTNLALKYNFKQIPMMDGRRIINKSNQKLQFQKQYTKNLIDAKKGQIVKRKIFIFEKK